LQRGCALMTRRMAVPAVWLHARARAAVCKLRTCARVTCARAARSRSSSLQVCGACSMRDPAKTYSECVLGDTSPAWMLVSPRGLAQLNAEGVVELLDNEGNTVSFHTRLLRHFVEFRGRTYHCHPDAVDLATGACDLCSDCVRVGRPTLGHALTAGRPHPCERLEAYYSWDAPEGSKCGVEHTRPRAGNASGPAAAIVFRVLHCVRGGSLQVAPLRSCPNVYNIRARYPSSLTQTPRS
jgi:hypothetical protein